MDYVLSLIGNPAEAAVTPDTLIRAIHTLNSEGAVLGKPTTLAQGVAGEVLFKGLSPERAAKAARAAFAGRRVDVNVLPAEGRRKRLIVADMDSTIITCECLDEIADFAGLKPRIAAITERAMRGELPFEAALRERVGLLKGLPAATLDQVYAERVQLMSGARTLLRTMRANGAHAVLVSGGFTFFTERVAAAAGFEAQRANTLIVKDGALTGEVGEPILGRDAKRATLDQWVADNGLSHQDALAVGDGANDLGMIEVAGLGVAYHAKPIVAEAARARIDVGDLTGLLYLQGYAKSEFVET